MTVLRFTLTPGQKCKARERGLFVYEIEGGEVKDFAFDNKQGTLVSDQRLNVPCSLSDIDELDNDVDKELAMRSALIGMGASSVAG